jgi:peroxiredoxin
MNKLLIIIIAILFPVSAYAAPELGAPAPSFTGQDSHGNEINLSDFLGKRVVLEWTNHECPYVLKHYDSENMQKLQKEMKEKDVVWLTIASSAPGNQGFTDPEMANQITSKTGAAPQARILDPSGEIGKLYQAKTTPHMFVIDKDGSLAYMGAIDDTPSANKSDVESAKNYVKNAIDALEKGQPVRPASTQPYGCSVKYSGM